MHQTLPLVFGKYEPWDPNRIPDWTKERVSLFLRRIGLLLCIISVLIILLDISIFVQYLIYICISSVYVLHHGYE